MPRWHDSQVDACPSMRVQPERKISASNVKERRLQNIVFFTAYPRAWFFLCTGTLYQISPRWQIRLLKLSVKK